MDYRELLFSYMLSVMFEEGTSFTHDRLVRMNEGFASKFTDTELESIWKDFKEWETEGEL